MSYETRYAAHMRMKNDAASSTPEALEARLKLNEAFARARKDCVTRFPNGPTINQFESFEDVTDYFNERISFWRRELKC